MNVTGTELTLILKRLASVFTSKLQDDFVEDIVGCCKHRNKEYQSLRQKYYHQPKRLVILVSSALSDSPLIFPIYLSPMEFVRVSLFILLLPRIFTFPEH